MIRSIAMGVKLYSFKFRDADRPVVIRKQKQSKVMIRHIGLSMEISMKLSENSFSLVNDGIMVLRFLLVFF